MYLNVACNNLWHRWWNKIRDPVWRGWEELSYGGVVSTLEADSWGKGRIDAAVCGSDNKLLITAYDGAFDSVGRTSVRIGLIVLYVLIIDIDVR